MQRRIGSGELELWCLVLSMVNQTKGIVGFLEHPTGGEKKTEQALAVGGEQWRASLLINLANFSNWLIENRYSCAAI